jgi:DNA repair exonuclease SbcCD ATPase subunit
MMGRRLSNEKKAEIVKLWLTNNLSYQEIKEKTGVSVGAISKVINEFRKDAEDHSVRSVAEKYGMVEEIDTLITLSDDLKKTGINIYDAKKGVELWQRLGELGVKVEEIGELVEFCKKIAENHAVDEIIPAAIRLSKLERERGMSYEALIADYDSKVKERDKITEEIELLEKKREEAEEAAKSLSNDCEEKRKELSRLSQLLEARKRESDAVEKEVLRLEEKKKASESILAQLKAGKEETEEALRKIMLALQENTNSLKNINEQLDLKRKELESLESKIKELKAEHDGKIKERERLESQLEELRKDLEAKQKRVAEYADYLRGCEEKFSRFNSVVAEIEGKQLTLKELLDTIATKLNEETEKGANKTLMKWEKEGVAVIVKEFNMTAKCPNCGKEFQFVVNPQFIARTIVGTGESTSQFLIFSLADLSGILSSPGSTTVRCPFCGNQTEITYDQIVKELKKQTQGSG